jgi:hypothetical protein
MDNHRELSGRPTAEAVTGPTGQASLPVIESGGFGATVDACASEPDTESSRPMMRLWLVSLLGSQQAVKAIWVLLMKGETATLTTDSGRAYFCSLASQGPRGWRFFRAPLPAAGGYHGMLVPELALYSAGLPGFLLLQRDADDPAMLHYRFLNRRVTLPLHPTWAEWLWARALRTGEARRLESYGLEAFLCTPDEPALTADLTEAIRHGVLGLADHVGQSGGVGSTIPASETGLHGPA